MKLFSRVLLLYLLFVPLSSCSIKTLSTAVIAGSLPLFTQKIQDADLFVFPTQKCGACCPFCIRVNNNQNDRPADSIIKDINTLVALKVVSRIRFWRSRQT